MKGWLNWFDDRLEENVSKKKEFDKVSICNKYNANCKP